MSDFSIEKLTHHYVDPEVAAEAENDHHDSKNKDQTHSVGNKTTHGTEINSKIVKSNSPDVHKADSSKPEHDVVTVGHKPDPSKPKPDIATGVHNPDLSKPKQDMVTGVHNPDPSKPKPDKVAVGDKEARIFKLTESEAEKETIAAGKMAVIDKTNEGKIQSEKTAYSILHVQSMCDEHDEEYIFICDRCDIPVCKMCVVREHKGHKLSDIDETAKMRENALANMLSPRVAAAERNSTEMEYHIANFESEISAVNMSIKLHGEAIKELVDKQVALMLLHVKEKADHKKNKYLDLSESLQVALEKGKTLQKRYEELAHAKNDGTVILALKKLAQDAETFNYPSVPIFSSVKYIPPKVTEKDIEPLFGAFSFIDMDLKTSIKQQPKIIPPPSIYSSPKHRWQCCRCGTDQVNEIYNNNLFFDCSKCRRSMYHLYRGKVYE